MSWDHALRVPARDETRSSSHKEISMNDQERAVSVLVSELTGTDACPATARLVKRAVATAARQRRSEVSVGEVILPPALVAALREISSAPAVGPVLALLASGFTPGFAMDVVVWLEPDDDDYYYHVPWRMWEETPTSLTWREGGKRKLPPLCIDMGEEEPHVATVVRLAPDGASLTRNAILPEEGAVGPLLGEWIWDAGGVLAEGWVDPADPRAGQLTRLLGVRDAR